MGWVRKECKTRGRNKDGGEKDGSGGELRPGRQQGKVG
jgi:hypothetical protein